MTLAEDLRPTLDACRSIPGELGLHPYRVYVVTRTWSGASPGHGTATDAETEILVGGQPPHVSKLSGETIAVNNLPSDTVQIGPLTPTFNGGGSAVSLFSGSLTGKQERWLKLVGPGHEDGTKLRIVEVNAASSLHIMVRAAPLANAE